MAEQKCPHCGGIYTDLQRKDESFEKITTYYYCNSCKKRFSIVHNKAAASGEWLFTLYHWDNGGDTVQFFHDSEGILIRQNISGVFRTTRQRPTIAPLGIEVYYDMDISYDHYSMPVHRIDVNPTRLSNVLQNPAMKAIHVSGNQFSLSSVKNDRLLNDIAAWLRFQTGALDHRPPTSSGGCYVATCVYGSYDCPQVWTLRRFRDQSLAKSLLGRTFIHAYYTVSPKIVKWFGGCNWFKQMWRVVLDRMVNHLQKDGFDSSPYDDPVW